MVVKHRIDRLRKLMKQYGMQAYIIPTDDFHGSEYVGEYFKVREYMSGFTGSAGTLVVTADVTCLWTDGRYFLQADTQLMGSGIRLMKIGEPGVPEISTFLFDQLATGACVGFDGRSMTMAFAKELQKKLQNKKITFVDDQDLAGEIWGAERPAMAAERIWELSIHYAGMTREQKLTNIRKKMEQKGAEYLVLSALDEISWLLNLRGRDVDFTPVFLSFMVISQDTAVLFLQEGVASQDIVQELLKDGITVQAYAEIYAYVQQLPKEAVLWIDDGSANYRLYKACEDCRIIAETSPVVRDKAIKNETEIKNLRIAHIKDGVAVTRLMYWLKTRVGKENITEICVADKLKKLRQSMEGYIDESFSPIIAYKEHGAIVHYEADTQSNAMLEPQGFCLADTGGQYLEGTTDITRTFALGSVTAEEKRMFTLVLKGHLRLSAAKFKAGTCGQTLDYAAREPLWAEGLDYNHGTGHGVGYLLNVHEAPPRISWKMAKEAFPEPFVPGMVCSNEPGIYLAGKFGIRHENLMLCCEDKRTEYGQFLCFENLTMVPFDKDAIEPELLNEEEIRWLNEYHKEVFEKISRYITGDELDWLKEATSPITTAKDEYPLKTQEK